MYNKFLKTDEHLVENINSTTIKTANFIMRSEKLLKR